MITTINLFVQYDQSINLFVQYEVDDIWTSGRLCNFHGCDAPHLQPKNIKGNYMFTTLLFTTQR